MMVRSVREGEPSYAKLKAVGVLWSELFSAIYTSKDNIGDIDEVYEKVGFYSNAVVIQHNIKCFSKEAASFIQGRIEATIGGTDLSVLVDYTEDDGCSRPNVFFSPVELGKQEGYVIFTSIIFYNSVQYSEDFRTIPVSVDANFTIPVDERDRGRYFDIEKQARKWMAGKFFSSNVGVVGIRECLTGSSVNFSVVYQMDMYDDFEQQYKRELTSFLMDLCGKFGSSLWVSFDKNILVSTISIGGRSISVSVEWSLTDPSGEKGV